jgi:predicted aspartyl protease
MGRVLVTAKIENGDDVAFVRQGALPADQVRSVEVHDALVDTGATFVGLPKRLIQQLGLYPVYTKPGRTASGPTTIQIHSSVRLTIQERQCSIEVMELPEDCPVLIGQVPLELMDFVVDPRGQRIIGNPAHGGEQIIEAY